MTQLWLILCLIGVTSSQPHPTDLTSAVTCLDCGGHAHPFPDCLAHPPKTCHPDEVCMLRYGGAHETTSHCHRAEQCQHEVGDASRQCSTGGAEVHGQCQICCTDTTCITHTLPLLSANPTLNVMALHCPTGCPADQVATCVTTGHLCHENQFCLVTRDAHVTGKCAEKRELSKCHHDVAAAVCDPHHHHCVVACCEDETCVSSVFTSDIITNQTPPTTVHSGGATLPATLTHTATVTHTAAPQSTHPVTTPPVLDPTDGPIVDPTGAPVTNASGACMDSIQQMSCADVTGVCESPLLSAYCQKFCGLCTDILAIK